MDINIYDNHASTKKSTDDRKVLVATDFTQLLPIKI